ncbi:MAG TPA: TrkA family potassium uptake protein [Patescibacteria group bacterium]|nr:TrkA family potassium uptake protein [Patescibacteria group bacterium]
MRAVIVGCGRVGATLARALDGAGHEVTIVDLVTRSFDRLPATFRGNAIRGDGTDEDTLRRAGAEGADLFVALTEGDNRNVMAAQLAIEALGVHRVFAKVNDPVRAQAYADLGIGTICRTTMLSDALLGALGQAGSGEPSIREGVGHHVAAPAVAASVGEG